jgi:phospholipid/cholesterol/gamma-HCH transport system substrate-binding protein
LKIRREVRIGLVVLIAFALFLWGVNFLKGKNLFVKERILYAEYDQVNGLEVASPVILNGFKIGQVEDINFKPGDVKGKLLVTLLIKNQIKLPSDSRAHIFSSDIVGSKAIELRLGSATDFLESGDTIATSIAASLQEEVSIQMLPLKAKAESLIQSFDSVLAVIQYVFNEGTRENLTRSFESIKLTIQNLESTSYNIDTLVAGQRTRLGAIISNVESISANIKMSNDKLTNIITNFSEVSDTLAALDFARTIYLTNNSLADLNFAVNKIKSGEGTLGMLVNNDTLYNNVRASAAELDRLLEDLRVNPQRYLHFSVFGRGPRQTRYIEPAIKE